MTYVNAYAVTREYGGPEEGGWWNDSGKVLLSIPCDSMGQAETEAKRAEKEMSHLNEGDICSARGGKEIRVLIEEDKGKDFPSERPYYE